MYPPKESCTNFYHLIFLQALSIEFHLSKVWHLQVVAYICDIAGTCILRFLCMLSMVTYNHTCTIQHNIK